MAELIEVGTIQQFESVLSSSSEHPLLIFKHSTRCPISAGAYEQVQSFLRDYPETDATFALIKVIESRDVSSEAAARLGVQHQSPQAILVKNGEAVWDRSHSRITNAALKEVLKGN